MNELGVKKHTLKLYLKTYWNDPGLAFWRAKEAELLSLATLAHPSLNLGCGPGFFTENLLSVMAFMKGKPIPAFCFGVEKEILLCRQAAMKKHAYRQVVAADISSLGFKDQSFKLVLSNCVLEHVKNIDNCLFEVARIISHNGEFIFTVVTSHFGKDCFWPTIFRKFGLSRLESIWINKIDKALVHYNKKDIQWWKESLKKYGFTVTEAIPYLNPAQLLTWNVLFSLARIKLYRYNLAGIMNFIKKSLGERGGNIFIDMVSKLAFFLIWPLYRNDKSGDGCALLIVAKKNNDFKTLLNK